MTSPYEAMGGEAAVRALVDRFYDHMDTLPEARAVRALHAQDLVPVREKLFQYLSGWLGGPQLYIQRHGHPKLRARHLPFSIRRGDRDAWMACMSRALEETEMPAELRVTLGDALGRLATHMINRE